MPGDEVGGLGGLKFARVIPEIKLEKCLVLSHENHGGTLMHQLCSSRNGEPVRFFKLVSEVYKIITHVKIEELFEVTTTMPFKW